MTSLPAPLAESVTFETVKCDFREGTVQPIRVPSLKALLKPPGFTVSIQDVRILNTSSLKATMLNFQCKRKGRPSNQSWGQATRFGPVMEIKMQGSAERAKLAGRSPCPRNVSYSGSKVGPEQGSHQQECWTLSPWGLQVIAAQPVLAVPLLT